MQDSSRDSKPGVGAKNVTAKRSISIMGRGLWFLSVPPERSIARPMLLRQGDGRLRIRESRDA